MSARREGSIGHVPLTQARARMIASEIPLTWRQVAWCVNRVTEDHSECRLRAYLGSWIEMARIEEAASWVWEVWLDQQVQYENYCDYDNEGGICG
jgi:lipocalin